MADFLFLQGCEKNLLLGRDQNLGAAHVGPQDLGDGDGAVGLEVVLQEGDEHTGRRHHGVVQRVAELLESILEEPKQALDFGARNILIGAIEHLRAEARWIERVRQEGFGH